MPQDTLAILVGGGPAPGINGVIAAATTEALRSGLRVVGLYEGYRHIARGDSSHTVELTAERIEGLHAAGGSYLRTSRTNPGKDEATLENCVRALDAIGARYLVTIGGDDTTFGATRIAAKAAGRIGVAAVPKTIDNDLPLPGNTPTFGFETARAVGTTIVESLIEDARTTTGRWYLAVAMGRTSGALALGIAKAAGATLALIPEEFPDRPVDLALVVDTLAGAIVKRAAAGRGDGVAVIAEGLAELLDPAALEGLDGLARDAYGHVRLADVPFGAVLRDALRTRLAELGLATTIVAKDIGYELRCAKPVAFDVEYTRALGYGAVRYLLGGGSGALIAQTGGEITPLTLADLLDPATGRIRVRRVDVRSTSYAIARAYMTQLEPGDLTEPRLAQISAATSLAPAEFAAHFARVVRAFAPA